MLAINERLFAIAESPDDRLGEQLRTLRSYWTDRASNAE